MTEYQMQRTKAIGDSAIRMNEAEARLAPGNEAALRAYIAAADAHMAELNRGWN